MGDIRWNNYADGQLQACGTIRDGDRTTEPRENSTGSVAKSPQSRLLATWFIEGASIEIEGTIHV